VCEGCFFPVSSPSFVGGGVLNGSNSNRREVESLWVLIFISFPLWPGMVSSLYGRDREGEEGRGGWQGGEMTQTMYTHVNKRIIKEKKRKCFV
jgi:hypothetical protein